MHKQLLIFILLTSYFSIDSEGQDKGNGKVFLKSGEYLKGELKFRENIYVKEIKLKTKQGRKRIPVEDIASLELAESVYKTVVLSSIEGQPAVLAEELKSGLYHGVFKEIICLCDNSYRMVEAYLVQDSELIILRKKAFQDHFVKDTDFSKFPYLTESPPSFSSFPDLYIPKTALE